MKNENYRDPEISIHQYYDYELRISLEIKYNKDRALFISRVGTCGKYFAANTVAELKTQIKEYIDKIEACEWIPIIFFSMDKSESRTPKFTIEAKSLLIAEIDGQLYAVDGEKGNPNEISGREQRVFNNYKFLWAKSMNDFPLVHKNMYGNKLSGVWVYVFDIPENQKMIDDYNKMINGLNDKAIDLLVTKGKSEPNHLPPTWKKPINSLTQMVGSIIEGVQ